MIREGQVVLFRFPQTNLATGKLRPALHINRVAWFDPTPDLDVAERDVASIFGAA
jgi:hypothetical protein